MLRRLPTAAHLSQPGRDLCHEAQPRLRQDQALPVLVLVLVLVPVLVPVPVPVPVPPLLRVAVLAWRAKWVML